MNIDTAMQVAKQAEKVKTYVYVDKAGTVMFTRVPWETTFDLVGIYGPGAKAADILADINAAKP